MSVQALFLLYFHDFVVDELAAPVFLSHIGGGISCIAHGSGSIVDDLYSHIFCPGGYLLVIIFIGRNVYRGVFIFNTGLAHGFVAFQHVLFKFLAGNQ